MNKPELISEIAERTGLSKKDTALFVEAFVETVTDTTASGEKVQVSGLGSFEKKETKGSEGVIHFGSRKGETWKTEDSYKASFSPAKAFTEKVKA